MPKLCVNDDTPAKPRPANPSSTIAQVEVSGTALLKVRLVIPPCGLTENTPYSIPEACSESIFPLSGKPSSSVSVATTTLALLYIVAVLSEWLTSWKVTSVLCVLKATVDGAISNYPSISVKVDRRCTA
jgi:hypothetical protein